MEPIESCAVVETIHRVVLAGSSHSRKPHLMKRILMVGPVPPPTGGIASVVEDIVHSELASEFSFELFPRPDFELGINRTIPRNIARVKQLVNFFVRLWRGNYYLIHIHSPDGAFASTTLFILLARLARTNMLVHMHGTDWDEFYTRRSAFRRLYTWIGFRIAPRMVVLYSLWAENIRKLCPTADVLVIRNLIHDQDLPQPAEVQQLKEKLGLTDEHFVVLTIGYLGWRKGSFVILNAVPQVASQDPSVRFVLVGSEEFPGQMAQLTQQADKENLAAWVTFTGEVERSKANLFYSLADVYLLPSFIEGMPITIIEALRSGLPVISTRVGGIPDMIEDRVSGLLLNPGAPEEIAEAVLLLRRDPELRKKLAEGARRTFDDKFEFSRGIGEIRSAYRSFER